MTRLDTLSATPQRLSISQHVPLSGHDEVALFTLNQHQNRKIRHNH